MFADISLAKSKTSSQTSYGRLASSVPPLLHGCLAHLECETYSHVEGGDHTILIGLVRRASRFEGEPLLFAQGQYSVADSHPEASPSPEVGGSKPGTSLEGTV